jgi:hypothetical protein
MLYGSSLLAILSFATIGQTDRQTYLKEQQLIGTDFDDTLL